MTIFELLKSQVLECPQCDWKMETGMGMEMELAVEGSKPTTKVLSSRFLCRRHSDDSPKLCH